MIAFRSKCIRFFVYRIFFAFLAIVTTSSSSDFFTEEEIEDVDVSSVDLEVIIDSKQMHLLPTTKLMSRSFVGDVISNKKHPIRHHSEIPAAIKQIYRLQADNFLAVGTFVGPHLIC